MSKANAWKKIVAFLVVALATVSSPSLSRARSSEDNGYPETRQLGPLTAMVIENVKGAPYVVYLHGWGGIGATAYEDLKTEIENSKILKEVNWIFPDAPWGGWFNIQAMDPSTTIPFYDVWQETLKPTRKALSQMLVRAKVDPRNVIWAGFSQGGITAIDFVLHAKTPAKALIVNSGMYFNSTDWKRGSEHLKGIRFFMSHDRRDGMLPYSQAKKAEALLLENGMIGRLQTASVDHAIPPGFMEKSIRVLLNGDSPANPRGRPSRSALRSCQDLFSVK